MYGTNLDEFPAVPQEVTLYRYRKKLEPVVVYRHVLQKSRIRLLEILRAAKASSVLEQEEKIGYWVTKRNHPEDFGVFCE